MNETSRQADLIVTGIDWLITVDPTRRIIRDAAIAVVDGGFAAVGKSAEIAADRLGLYLAARAGFDVAAAPGLWDRLAVEQPWSLSDDVEHYGSNSVPPHGYMASRAVAVRAIVAEIESKRDEGAPLVP